MDVSLLCRKAQRPAVAAGVGTGVNPVAAGSAFRLSLLVGLWEDHACPHPFFPAPPSANSAPTRCVESARVVEGGLWAPGEGSTGRDTPQEGGVEKILQLVLVAALSPWSESRFVPVSGKARVTLGVVGPRQSLCLGFGVCPVRDESAAPSWLLGDTVLPRMGTRADGRSFS